MTRPAQETGPVRVWRQRATAFTSTNRGALATVNTIVPEIGPAPERGRGKRARTKPTPIQSPPASQDLTFALNCGGDGDEGQHSADLRSRSVLVTTHTRATVQELVALQKRRVLTIKEVNGSVSRIEHLMVEMLGHDGTEKSRKAAFARARAYRLAVERAGEDHVTHGTSAPDVLSGLTPLILQSAMSRSQWPILREIIEKDMERLAKTLPGADYVSTVNGLGWRGFAVICAEAIVPLAEYRTVSGLWKHMGFAVIDGRRQQGIRGERKTKEEAMKLFHPKERRGQLYGFLQDALFRQQWNADKLSCVTCTKRVAFEWEDGTPVCDVCGTRGEEDAVILAHAAGPYGEVYAKRRAHTASRVIETDHLDLKDPKKWTMMRCKNDATRVMAKAVLRDLWRVSRGLPPRRLD